ncbi:hypothetical protein [Staphylococcus massiliensis]|uniref:Uncharacterized protein n=1 Tax=Staphylococcus massiliensis S46 TaxID=1229783 RepID=K9B648_9STAP|nr:hypothetical protein [Staphylococcus massiliensis]EKU50292.1 hypothetical protein C273_01580 [Staphylococcus massiliensis S46]MCG3399682.1 hypothetical protein [Staphylococcus massiliensis]MCG3400787.1 hypothetical protein [Staphylococcus massiliensis]MCG3412049.1 hypothetical protein [Staphylococcus massiliensis]PNZ99041.1 hypothetical protein CD133_07085 [Staphylococcus massiliensis CCUG 55927]
MSNRKTIFLRRKFSQVDEHISFLMKKVRNTKENPFNYKDLNDVQKIYTLNLHIEFFIFTSEEFAEKNLEHLVTRIYAIHEELEHLIIDNNKNLDTLNAAYHKYCESRNIAKQYI